MIKCSWCNKDIDSIFPSDYCSPKCKFEAEKSGHRPCFLGGTPILMADGSWRPIEDVSEDSLVAAFDCSTRQIVPRRVSERSLHVKAVVDRITWGDGEIFVTSNHLVFSGSKWSRVGSLKVGDDLLVFEGGLLMTREIRAIDRRTSAGTVFNLYVDFPCSYVAGGVVSHSFSVLRSVREFARRFGSMGQTKPA